MRLSLLVVLYCVIGVSLANHLWIGTWTNEKRPEFGGNFYICVDLDTDVAYGTYGGGGIARGSIKNGVWTGSWFEAGYDRPYGTFELTISNGNTIAGTWQYAGDDEVFTWTGTKTDTETPSNAQCLKAARADSAAGTYENIEHICLRENVPYQNTPFDTSSASFEGFGIVEGYTTDNGKTLLMSDFYYQADIDDDEDEQYRPENNGATFGLCDDDCNADAGDDEIQTNKIIVGALIDDGHFCGWFWDGLYNYKYADEVTCFSRTSIKTPDASLCGFDAGAKALQHGHTAFILDVVQDAFDALSLPDVEVILGQFSDDDDEGHYGPGYFSQFLTAGDIPSDNIIYVPVPVPTPVLIPVPYPYPVYIDDDDNNNDDDNNDDDNNDDDNNDDGDDEDNRTTFFVYLDDDGNVIRYEDDEDRSFFASDDDEGNTASAIVPVSATLVMLLAFLI